MIAGSGDNAAAALGRGDGRFRASRGEREQVVELLKTAFVDERLTREELDARVGHALASRTRADLAAVTADLPAGPDVSQVQSRPPAKYVARHAAPAKSVLVKPVLVKPVPAKPGSAKPGSAGAGGAVAVAVKVTLILMFVTSIPPLFLLLVLCCVTAMIVTVASVLSSRR